MIESHVESSRIQLARTRWWGTLAFASIVSVGGCVGGCVAVNVQDNMQDTHASLSLAELPVAVQQRQMAVGAQSARDFVANYLARIERLDRKGPALNSVIELNPQAMVIAAQLDQQQHEHRQRGPLHGISVLLKDNIDTADDLLTTAGSLALADSRPEQDAFIVSRLRSAGAIILGKTNPSEWANFRGRGSTSGWSTRGGQTRNPYVLDRSPSGSSSGSAVAVAAGLTALAVGTETSGSIVSPASVNGIVGIKPTLGLVSRSGIVPLAASLDTAGPMARTVADAAALLSVLAGYDANDPATAATKDQAAPDYTRFLNENGLQGARIGVLRKAAGFHSAVDAVFEAALNTLRAQGAVLVDGVEIATQGRFGQDVSLLMRYEFKDGINRYLALRKGTGPKSLEELIAFNELHSARTMPYFGQSYFYEAQTKGPLSDTAYVEAQQRARELAGPQGIDATLRKDQLDALVAPTRGPAGMIDWVLGDHSVGGIVGFAPAVAGYPHITVPMGQVHGLPVGLSFVAGPWSESKLIAYAYAFEQASHARIAPRFRRTIE